MSKVIDVSDDYLQMRHFFDFILLKKENKFSKLGYQRIAAI